MDNAKLLGIRLALLFIVLGFNLIEKENQLPVTIGYANIILWSGLILFALYKIMKKKKI